MASEEHLAFTVERATPSTTDVVLISMPFGPLLQPSIGVSYLKAALVPLNISTEILYLTLQFAELIGAASYDKVSNGEAATYDLVGEWIFSGALFDTPVLDVQGYIDDVLHRGAPGAKDARKISAAYIDEMLRIRTMVEPFLESCVQTILARSPKIVGFTSIFQQHIASLALAKRLKQHAPELTVIFGGANCEGIMATEIVRQFSFVDMVVSGEGDIVFPQLVQRLLAQQSIANLQGVHTRTNVDVIRVNGHVQNAPSIRDMNTLPIPDYDDFFNQLAMVQFDMPYTHRLLFETSRGCWWGEKNHCTFCGLNGVTMAFRSKSAERALDELIHLSNKYPGAPISVVDNIMDVKYFKDFIPQLAERQLNLNLFYEVKANLRKEQVRLLRTAGITMIQPGIESLSNAVLTIMRKGIKGLQNIQLLKWCKEFGITPYWNVLWGFPGEPPEEYARMATLVPLLSHLHPPGATATIRLDRFSPNFDEAERLGFANVTPYPVYRYIYPFAPEVIKNLAYYFTFDYQQPQDVASYTHEFRQALATWRKTHTSSDLFSVDKGTSLLIWDLRPNAKQPLTVLDGLQRLCYISCDGIQTLQQLKKLAEDHNDGIAFPTNIEDILQPLIEQGLMLREGNSFLSLAIPLGEYAPKKAVLERFQEVLQNLGQTSQDQIVISISQQSRKEVELVG